MTYQTYFNTLARANEDSLDAFRTALKNIIEREKELRQYEEDMNQLDKQQHEAWFHQQDQEMSDG